MPTKTLTKHAHITPHRMPLSGAGTPGPSISRSPMYQCAATTMQVITVNIVMPRMNRNSGMPTGAGVAATAGVSSGVASMRWRKL